MRNREAELGSALERLPAFAGAPVPVYFKPRLTVRGRRLESGGGLGTEVHAASDLRRRIIVLDSALRGGELRRVLAHELFHFAWLRLGNPARASWTALIGAEIRAGARGELGWSAEWRKEALPLDKRGYLCESFCDSAAYVYAGIERHAEFTLPARYRRRRLEWFRNQFGSGRIRI
ncbi:MAG: hypothetical protein FJW39_25700 [Acidobacteria bacterium]|nr:hypothetical protein [Acidobacteriota bacterium]